MALLIKAHPLGPAAGAAGHAAPSARFRSSSRACARRGDVRSPGRLSFGRLFFSGQGRQAVDVLDKAIAELGDHDLDLRHRLAAALLNVAVEDPAWWTVAEMVRHLGIRNGKAAQASTFSISTRRMILLPGLIQHTPKARTAYSQPSQRCFALRGCGSRLMATGRRRSAWSGGEGYRLGMAVGCGCCAAARISGMTCLVLPTWDCQPHWQLARRWPRDSARGNGGGLVPGDLLVDADGH
jgi:hypothetical protein